MSEKIHNLPKLLRTLIEYKADFLIIPTKNSPRLKIAKNWHNIEEHPHLDENELNSALAKLLKESFADIENGEEISLKVQNQNILCWLSKFKDGMIFFAKRLDPVNETLVLFK